MSDTFIRLPQDDNGKKIRTIASTLSASNGEVHQQVVKLIK